jgi:IclR family acetate operon transcriptional repressor
MYLHSTSVGKCLIAWLPKPEIEELLREQNLKKRTTRTITSMTRLLAELERVRHQGHAVDDEENSPGARCVGAPIFDALGNVIAALGVSGTLSQVDQAKVSRVADALKETSRRITRHLARTGAA